MKELRYKVLAFLVFIVCISIPIYVTASNYVVGTAQNYLFSTDPDLGTDDSTISSQNAIRQYVNNYCAPAAGTFLTLTNISALPNAFDLATLSTGIPKITVSGGQAVISIAVPGTDYLTSCPTTTTYAPNSIHALTTQSDSSLPNDFNLGSLSTGLFKITVSGGVAVPSIAVVGVDYIDPSTMAASYQPLSANLTLLANISFSNTILSMLSAANTLAIKAALGYYSSGDSMTGTFIGSLQGNASTATKLNSTPTTCSAGYAPLGIDAYGNVTGCWNPQALNASLTSLGNLTYSSNSIVRMIGANTFSLDTTSYQPSGNYLVSGGNDTVGNLTVTGASSINGLTDAGNETIAGNLTVASVLKFGSWSSSNPASLPVNVTSSNSAANANYASNAGNASTVGGYAASAFQLAGNYESSNTTLDVLKAITYQSFMTTFFGATSASNALAQLGGQPAGNYQTALTNPVTGPGSSTSGYIPQWSGTGGNVLGAGVGLVTTLGTPGSNTNIPSEAAVRAAISASGGRNITGTGISTSNAIAIYSGTTGLIISNSPDTIASNGTINIPSGATYNINGAALNATNVGALASNH